MKKSEVRSQKEKMGWLLVSHVMVLVWVLCGCAGSGTVKREAKESEAVDRAASIAAQQAMTVRRVVEGEKRVVVTPVVVTPPAIEVSGTNNRVEVRTAGVRSEELEVRSQKSEVRSPEEPGVGYREEVEVRSEGQQGAGDSERVRTTRWESVSPAMWLTLVGSGVGLLLILRAVMAWRASSVAVDAGFRAGDEVLAEMIRGLRSKAASSTDAAELARLNAEVAELEGKRGRRVGKRS